MEPDNQIDFQTDDLWADGEAEKLKAAIKARPSSIYAIEPRRVAPSPRGPPSVATGSS